MSRKQAIYQELLKTGLSSIRNAQTESRWKKAITKSCYYDAELLHSLSVSILNEEFTDHDIWILNNQALWYCEKAKEGENMPFLPWTY